MQDYNKGRWKAKEAKFQGMKEGMGNCTTNAFKAKPHFLLKRLLPYLLYAIFPIAFFRLYFYPSSLPQSPSDQLPINSPIFIASAISSNSSSPSPSPPPAEEDLKFNGTTQCDYTDGKWVPDKSGPLYNYTSCSTIKYGQNCMRHGRPDSDYLYWRWKPRKYNLSRFDPEKFLIFLRNKHLAFVGDSMARNQLESLLCMLASFSPPTLVYTSGDDNKFRRWHFPSHNVSVSVYWSPFLVEGIEKHEGQNYNKLYMDLVNERWASDLGLIDMIVLSIGHWYLHPAVYFEGDLVLGCHFCSELNHTEIGFYDVFRKAYRTALKAIIERRGGNGNGIDVVVTTFSPHHFEGEWDKAGACPKQKPYKESEKALEGMDAEMRRIGVEEVEAAKLNGTQHMGGKIRLAALDVTKLALLRPDGHPGPYMHPFPFANGVQEHVQNDCVHWCLPGPIDTWNQIMLEIIKGWKGKAHSVPVG
ncbi:Xyloglucan O-acetyltransferase 1 [Ancistrocladus abbreviatus]